MSRSVAASLCCSRSATTTKLLSTSTSRMHRPATPRDLLSAAPDGNVSSATSPKSSQSASASTVSLPATPTSRNMPSASTRDHLPAATSGVSLPAASIPSVLGLRSYQSFWRANVEKGLLDCSLALETLLTTIAPLLFSALTLRRK